MKKKGFTLIELLVVVAIIGAIAGAGIPNFIEWSKVAECSGHKEQHKKVVSLAKETYGFCSLNGYTNMNITALYGFAYIRELELLREIVE